MARHFEADDVGKRVVSVDGDPVGTCRECRGDTAAIAPNTDVGRTLRQRLGWPDDGRETYQLKNTMVDRITDDEIRLRRPPNA
jgi:hypothetical protein